MEKHDEVVVGIVNGSTENKPWLNKGGAPQEPVNSVQYTVRAMVRLKKSHLVTGQFRSHIAPGSKAGGSVSA